MKIALRLTRPADLEHFFHFQLDSEAQKMAAFVSANPTDKAAYLHKWNGLLNDEIVNMQTILFEDEIAGSIAKYEMGGKAEVTYWIDRNHWGKGLASMALVLFLDQEPSRPLYARVAFDNIGSQRVLEKSGFTRIGEDRGFANARGAEISEYIYRRN
jgi:ribosomal-protein-alanine N-acetyltransferase